MDLLSSKCKGFDHGARDYGTIEEIHQAFDIANEAGLSLAELDLVER